MKTVHIMVGENASQKIKGAFAEDSVDEVFILNDLLNFGVLKTEQMTFSEGRIAFWASIGVNKKPIEDLEQLMKLSTRLSNKEALKIWFWMAGNAEDLCAYYWLIHFLKKHQGKLSIINIAGLPFIDERGKLFYAEDISDLPQKEIIKARKLARQVLPSEWETDGEEWRKLVSENAALRINKGGKAIEGADVDHYDDELKAAVSADGVKSHKVIHQLMSRHRIRNAASFLHWRLNLLLSQLQPNDDREIAEAN